MSVMEKKPEESVRFQLAVPPDLATDIASIPGVSVRSVEEASDRLQHDLAIETVVVIVTLLVSLQELAPTCKKIAQSVHRFFAGQKDEESKLKVIGKRAETTLEIRLEGVDATAENIRVTVQQG